MNWSDERYVRIYTRDTPAWLCLSILAQGLFCLILRKVDRSGVLELGQLGRRGVAIAVGFPGEWSRLEPALEELVSDGCIQVTGDRLVAPNFLEAQEAEASDKARSKAYRERRRDQARAGVTRSQEKRRTVSEPSQGVALRHEPTGVRDGGDTGRDVPATERVATVTPSRAVPSVPPEPAAEAATAAADPFGTEPNRPRLVVVDETGLPPTHPQHPLVAAFRQALADRLAVPADWLRVASPERVAGVRDDLERELTRVGVLAAVEASFEAAVREQRTGRRKPQHLAWYLRIIQDLTPAGAEPPPQPKRQVVVGFDAVGRSPRTRG